MYRFWDTIIEPILEIIRPQSIVEIGSDQGYNTAKLLAFCHRHGACLHAIDPLPKFDVATWQEQHGERFVFHQSLSLNALPKIDRLDVVLIDGDHNWYTVFHELKLIEKRCADLLQPFPLVMLHDIGWPYGRRDQYYDPENIPNAYRQPYRQKGMRPGMAELQEKGGLNAHLCNAIYEHNLQNGVLTAVEDFLKETGQQLELVQIPGFHGLGMLVPLWLKEQYEELVRFLRALDLSLVAARHLERVEGARVELHIKWLEQGATLRQLEVQWRGEVERLQGEVAARTTALQTAEATAAQLRQQLAESERTLASAQQRLSRAEAELVELRATGQEERRRLEGEVAARTTALQTAEATVTQLRQQVTELERALAEKGRQLSLRNDELKRRAQDITRLANWIGKLDRGFQSVLGSKRWKLGHMLGSLYRRMRFKPPMPMPQDYWQSLMTEFELWRRNFEDRNKGERTNQDGSAVSTSPGLSSPTYIRESKKKAAAQGAVANATPMHQGWTAGEQSSLGRREYCSAVPAIAAVEVAASSTIREGEKKRIAVIVPVYNAYEEVTRCVKSILQNTPLSLCDIILIDDCSSDERIWPLLQSYANTYRNVLVARNEQNIGWTATVNKGCVLAGRNDVVLLNSDTQVTPRWLNKLATVASTKDRVATVTPLSNAAGAFSIPENNAANHLPAHMSIDDMGRLVEQLSRRIYPQAPTGNGFCMYVTRRTFDAVGYFDDKNFPGGYGAENDFCMRASAAGFIHLIDDSTFIYHERSASFKDRRDAVYREGQARLNQLYPHYKQAVDGWLANDPLADFRQSLKTAMHLSAPLQVQGESGRLTILYILHDGAGGTILTSGDLAKEVAKTCRCLILKTAPNQWMLLECTNGEERVLREFAFPITWRIDTRLEENRLRILREVCSAFHVHLAHIRHLLASGPEIIGEFRSMGIPIIFSFHDFYTVCPTIHLIDDNGTYCGGYCTAGIGECQVSRNWIREIPPLKKQFVYSWRKRVGELLRLCDAYVATSRSTKNVLVDHFPFLADAEFRIIEHGRDLHGYVPCSVPPEVNPIKIVFFGALGQAKGTRLVEALMQMNMRHRGPFEFHILGKKVKSFEPERYGGVYHGPYEQEELPSRLAEISPSFSLIPSVWPETFCHTLTESWAAGIPVLASDIGALRERIMHSGGGWLLDPNDPQSWYEKMAQLTRSPDEYKRHVEKIRRMHFKTVAEMATEYIELYSEVIAATKNALHIGSTRH